MHNYMCMHLSSYFFNFWVVKSALHDLYNRGSLTYQVFLYGTWHRTCKRSCILIFTRMIDGNCRQCQPTGESVYNCCYLFTTCGNTSCCFTSRLQTTDRFQAFKSRMPTVRRQILMAFVPLQSLSCRLILVIQCLPIV